MTLKKYNPNNSGWPQQEVCRTISPHWWERGGVGHSSLTPGAPDDSPVARWITSYIKTQKHIHVYVHIKPTATSLKTPPSWWNHLDTILDLNKSSIPQTASLCKTELMNAGTYKSGCTGGRHVSEECPSSVREAGCGKSDVMPQWGAD